jgi:hypothetical protein
MSNLRIGSLGLAAVMVVATGCACSGDVAYEGGSGGSGGTAQHTGGGPAAGGNSASGTSAQQVDAATAPGDAGNCLSCCSNIFQVALNGTSCELPLGNGAGFFGPPPLPLVTVDCVIVPAEQLDGGSRYYSVDIISNEQGYIILGGTACDQLQTSGPHYVQIYMNCFCGI